MSVERTKIDSILELKPQKQQENLLKEAVGLSNICYTDRK